MRSMVFQLVQFSFYFIACWNISELWFFLCEICTRSIKTYDVLIHLGYLDPPELQPYRKTPSSPIDTSASRSFTLESVQQTIVLLKNLNNTLPLDVHR